MTKKPRSMIQKLIIRREAIRQLSDGDLNAVRGGDSEATCATRAAVDTEATCGTTEKLIPGK